MPRRLAILFAALAACGSSHHTSTCNPADPSACAGGQVCEAVQGAQPVCFDPVVLSGTVYDLAVGKPSGGIVGARVVALDVNGAPATGATTSTTGGAYSLPLRATRDASGAPISSQLTLRADAAGYNTFPSGIRVAVPIDVSGATHGAGTWTVHTSLTDIGLVVAAGAGAARIHGTVASAPASGALVVAEPTASPGTAGQTAVADSSGAYVIFNLPVGSWTVTAYAKGANYAPGSTTLAAGDDHTVDLSVANVTTATVTGTLQPSGQNQPASLDTSVILVVRSTYQPSIDRGEAPPGVLVTGLTTPAFSIPGVPDGEYTVLAAFGNDGYVRDISGIGGTTPVDVTVSGGVMTSTAGTFKITGAVSFAATNPIAPASGTEGAITIVSSATPTFTWVAYPSATQYDVDVFDALGGTAWHAVYTGGETQATYAGSALVSGMTYQVRVTAYGIVASKLSQASRTEDLLGIFTYRP